MGVFGAGGSAAARASEKAVQGGGNARDCYDGDRATVPSLFPEPLVGLPEFPARGVDMTEDAHRPAETDTWHALPVGKAKGSGLV